MSQSNLSKPIKIDNRLVYYQLTQTKGWSRVLGGWEYVQGGLYLNHRPSNDDKYYPTLYATFELTAPEDILTCDYIPKRPHLWSRATTTLHSTQLNNFHMPQIMREVAEHFIRNLWPHFDENVKDMELDLK